MEGLSFLFKRIRDQRAFSREDFSEEQKEIFEMVSSFAREEIFPIRKELSKLNKELTFEFLKKTADLGLAKAEIPEEYDGLGLPKTTSALIAEGLSRGSCESFCVTFIAHTGIGTLPILYYGNEEQKKKYLPKLGNFEILSSYALTEPQAGSDVSSIKTEARKEGNFYILKGQKQFITNAGWADLFIVFAKTSSKDISAFIVEKNFGGITIGGEEEKMGIKGSSTCSVILEDCRVPKENLLGEEGKGMEIALNILNVGRFKLGAATMGGAKSCFDFALDYALQRKQFSLPIAHFQPIRLKFARNASSIFACDAMVYRTAELFENVKGEELEKYAVEASICKIFGSETLGKVSDESIQILGGYGFTEEYLPAQVYRDTRIDRIYEGTNEINRLVIYSYILRDSLLEKIPLRGHAKEFEKIINLNFENWEENFLNKVQGLIVYLFERAIVKHGQDLRQEGILGEIFSNFLIYHYSALSSYLRYLKSKRKEHLMATQIFLCEYLKYLYANVPVLLPMVFEEYEMGKEEEKIYNFLFSLKFPYNYSKLVKLFTDYLYHHKKYFLD